MLLSTSGCGLGRRRAISTSEKNTVLNMKFNDFTFIFRQIFMAEGCGRRGGGFGGGVVEMNVNEQSGLFNVLIRCNNPKLIGFGLQRHAEACIIWGRVPDASRTSPLSPPPEPRLTLDLLYLQLSTY